MKRILTLKTSISGADSASNQLVDHFLGLLGRPGIDYRNTELNTRDKPVPELDGRWLGALTTPADQRSVTQQAQVERSDRYIAELQDADLLVMGAPMYNFSVSSGLKAWIDHVARAGVTFRYSQDGPEGLLRGKQALIVATMGGNHEPGQTDHLRPYLKTVLGFLGLDDVVIVTAAALNLGAEQKQSSLRRARRELSEIAQDLRKTFITTGSSREAA